MGQGDTDLVKADSPQAKVKSNGRIGEIIRHDPDDKEMTYKIQFADGALPEADWFAGDNVEVLGGEILPASKPSVPAVPEKAELEEAEDWDGRVKGTPVMDEAFICMGSKAPRCPKPVAQVMSGPITLDVLQGAWTMSGGAQVVVIGTQVQLNGLPLQAHPVQMRDDGTVLSIGSLWQLDGWGSDGGIEFRCNSTRENMEYAKLEIWTRKQGAPQNQAAEMERLRLLGYAGSAAAPLQRGVEGCMPGTTGAEMPAGHAAEKDAKDIALLGALISQWREPDLCKVLSKKVVPDATNRSQTGLGVELVHFVASSMRDKGFRTRKGKEGHDIPVLVREPPGDYFHEEALKLWRERVAEEEGFPPVRVSDEEEIFTSLGNGHFFQALNCFATQHPCINQDGCYTVGQDAGLAEALSSGVPSLVLKHETPRPVRAKIAELLNSKRDFMWTLGEDGNVDVSKLEENTAYCSQFEWLSKGMDASQVNCLVRTHLGIRDSKRIEG